MLQKRYQGPMHVELESPPLPSPHTTPLVSLCSSADLSPAPDNLQDLHFNSPVTSAESAIVVYCLPRSQTTTPGHESARTKPVAGHLARPEIEMSSSSRPPASEHRDRGNAFFSERKYDKALSSYSEAIVSDVHTSLKRDNAWPLPEELGNHCTEHILLLYILWFETFDEFQVASSLVRGLTHVGVKESVP